MPGVKGNERSATLSFCQNAPFLAAGSVAGAIDLSFSTSSVLEIFSLDFGSTSHDLKLAGGAVQAPERFARLAWSGPGADTATLPYGLLGGGLADGSVCIWNPARIVGKPASSDGRGHMLCRLQKHQGAVRGLEFNPFSPNLLASGAADGDLCIWDLGTPAQPSLYPAMKGGAPGPAAEITCLSWNRKVQHILGTATAAGAVVVWDLKKQRPVISFKDPNGRRRCSAVAWNPEVATQLVVASDDDASPSLQLWDLRNSVSPLMELHGHAKGVLAASWCPQDSALLLSSGKDHRIVVWDVPSGTIYRELPQAHNWAFDVQWAPGSAGAGVFASATFEGQLSVQTLAQCQPPAPATDANGYALPAPAAAKAPAWMKRPAGACFGFGGKLVQVVQSKRQLPTGEVCETATVEIRQVQTDDAVPSISPEFEGVIRSADRDALRALCERRAAALAAGPSPQEAEDWAFLQTHFEADGKRHLLARLGFEDAMPLVEEDSAAALPEAGPSSEGLAALSLEQQHQAAAASAAAGQILGDGADFFSKAAAEDGNAFFENLPSPQGGPSPMAGAGAAAAAALAAADAAAAATAAAAPPPAERPIVDGPPGEAEDQVHRALLVGNYTGAVEACLRVGRHADALIAASLVGGDTWVEARREYMLAHPRPFMRVVHAMLSGDWDVFVAARPAAAWRETLAAILTSAPYERFSVLVGALAARLAAASLPHPAALCHIASGDVDAAVRLWTRAASGAGASPAAKSAVMEKAVVLGLGVEAAGSSSALGDLLARHAEALAANGRLAAAYDLLSLVPGEGSTKAAVLRDRIYRTGAAQHAAPPAFPFTQETVGGASAQAAGGYGQHAAYGTQPQQQQPQQQNGYAPSSATSYGRASAYGAAPSPPPQQPPPSAVYQPAAPAQFGGYAPQPPPPPPQQPAVFQPAAPPAMYGSQPGYQQSAPPTASPAAAAPPPTVFQPAVAPMAQYQPTQAAPATYQQPPAVYQQSAAPAAAPAPPTYQHQPAGPGAGAPPPMQVYQPASAGPAPMQQQPAVYQPQRPAAFAPLTGGSGGFGGALGSPHGSMPPTPAAPPPPPPPSGPPAGTTVATADTSAVPPEMQPVVASLMGLFSSCEAAAGAHPGKRREVDDASRRLGALLWKLNAGEVTPGVAAKLQQLCAALDAGDYATAAHVQVGLTTSDWDECSGWLTALKRLIKTRQMGG